MKRNNKNKFVKLFSELSKENRNNISNLMNDYNVKRINIKKYILWLIAAFLTFILEFETIYVINGYISGWNDLAVVAFFIAPMVFNYLLAPQYENIGKGIIYQILKALQKISLLSPILLFASLLLYVFTQQELVMLITASISVALPIIIILADIVIVTCFDMHNKDKPKTV